MVKDVSSGYSSVIISTMRLVSLFPHVASDTDISLVTRWFGVNDENIDEVLEISEFDNCLLEESGLEYLDDWEEDKGVTDFATLSAGF